VRAAIVGPGWVGRVHAHALRELGVDLVAVCGRTQEGAEALARDYGATACDDLGALLDATELDALHVCTPNHLHAPQTLLALERGLHVVCEKPLALSSEESARMVAAAEGRVGAVAHHVRGYPLVAHMRGEIANGALGEVRVVHGRYLNDEALFPEDHWHFDPERSGPSYAMGDLGVHLVDTLEHVTGLRITEVFAEARSFRAGLAPLDDTMTVVLRLDSGAVGSLLVGGTAPGRKNQLLLECEGSGGGFTWDQEEPELLVERPLEGGPRRVWKSGELARFPPGHGEGYGDAFRNILDAAYGAMRGEPHGSFATFADGHRGMQILEAIVRSAREGRWVTPS
jgi:predicted dehydrogenase